MELAMKIGRKIRLFLVREMFKHGAYPENCIEENSMSQNIIEYKLTSL